MSKIFLAVLCILLGISSPAFAEKCDRRFRISVNAYRPFYGVDHYGQVSGLTYDIVKELERRTDCILQQQPAAMPRMVEDFKNWRTDLIAFIAVSDVVSQAGNFLELYTVRRKLIIRKSFFVKDKKMSEYINDPKIKFTNQIGSRPYLTKEELEVLRNQNRLIQVPSPEVSYQMLIDGRAQASFSSAAVHNYYLTQKKELKDQVISVPDTAAGIPVGLFISKKRINTAEAAKFKMAVTSMRTDGSLRKILLKYIRAEDLQDYEGLR